MIKRYRLKDMKNGWFIGNFFPTLYKTNDVEVGVKKYSIGDSEKLHYHKIATEFTVILSGEVVMNNEKYESGDILVIEPGVSTDFFAVSNVTTLVVKIPGAYYDKYVI
jgi:mannose-6-phosphate isomerase-like protein (cupin superfamily)